LLSFELFYYICDNKLAFNFWNSSSEIIPFCFRSAYFSTFELGLHVEVECVVVAVVASVAVFLVAALQFVVVTLVVAARTFGIVNPSHVPFYVWLCLPPKQLKPIYHA
jgi:hypothetical protein